MEKVLCEPSPAVILNESMNPSFEKKDDNLEKFSTEINEKANYEVSSVIKSDSETFSNGESTKTPDSLSKKSFSPKIIESAINVVKNLFSPDKTKGKSTYILSPVTQPLSSGSPNNSICMTGNTEVFSSEPDTEIYLKVQQTSGENILKNHLQNDDLGIIQSPLNLEPLNNTDESFLTTVSIIEESFQSAITNFDDDGDNIKNGVDLVENDLNNSKSLNLMDPYNDTLENSESLENTTLKPNNFTSDGDEINNVLMQNKDENVELLNNPEIIDIPNTSGSEKVQCEELQRNSCSSSPQNELSSDVGVLMKSNSKTENTQDVEHPESLNAAPIGNYQDVKSTGKDDEALHLFLNKSFEKQATESETGLISDEPDFCVENSISTTTVVLRTVDSVVIDNMLMSLKADDSETNTSSVTSFDSDDIISLENMAGKMPMKEFDRTSFKQTCESDSCALENCFSIMHEKKVCINEKNHISNNSDGTQIKLDRSDELIEYKNSNEFPEIRNEKDTSEDVMLMKNNEALENSKQLHANANDGQTQAFQEHDQREFDEDVEDLHLSKQDTVTVISQQSYTILTHDNSLNRPVIEPLSIDNGHVDKKTFQLNEAIVTPSALENVEKQCANNCSSASFVTDELVKHQLKQSTPLWEKHNESSQKFFRPDSLKLDSLGSKEPSHDCDTFHETEQKSNTSKPDSIVKENEVFHHQVQVEYSPVNPVSDNEFPLSESVDSGGNENSYDLCRTKIVQSKAENDTYQDFVKQLGVNESRKSPDNLNRNLDKAPSPEPKNVKQAVCKSPNSPTTSTFNQTFDKKTKLPCVSGKNQSSDTPKPKLNCTFDKQPVSPKKNVNRKMGTPEFEKANQTFTKRKGSPEINSINRTFDKPETPKSDKLNKTYEKTVNEEWNRTFDKNVDDPGSQVLNKTFEKKSGSPLACESTLTFDGISLDGNQNNQTFCKSVADPEKKSQGINEMCESVDSGKTTENRGCNVSSGLEAKVENVVTHENEIFDNKTSPVFGLNSLTREDQHSINSDLISSECLEGINKNFPSGSYNGINDSISSTKSTNVSLGCSDLSTVLLNEEGFSSNQSTDEILKSLEKMNINENSESSPETRLDTSVGVFPEITSVSGKSEKEQNFRIQEKLKSSLNSEKLNCDSDIVQLIQEQFSLNDIEKICDVANELTSMKLNSEVLKTNVQSVSPFQENTSGTKLLEAETNSNGVNALSPKSFDFLSSIRGKPTGRDLSRESLYVKFDPLVQPSANSLIDFTKEGEQLAVTLDDASLTDSHSTSVCEKLLTISPQKKTEIVPPLTPLSDKMKTAAKEDKNERLKELQNEIYFLKNLFAEKERLNREKAEDYESQIAKLTGENCMLEDKLKESGEREKSLVKKMKEQTQSIGQLHVIMEEYSKVISKLTTELDTIKKENQKQTEALSLEKDSYMTHLQNTEAAFTDVHTKYEKSKKTIVNLKANEAMYRNTIAEQAQKLEEFKAKAKEAQEKAFLEFQKVQEQLHDTKANHNQESARLRALLRKTELKVEALQESLDQKLKENQQLTAICDELIEGKK